MQLAIPREALGLKGTDTVSLNFKWMDNMQNEGDAMEFYLNGDCAPNERYCYRFTNSPTL